MNMAKRSLLIATSLLACKSLVVAQPAPENSARSLLVNVLDHNGNAVRNLTKDNFRVKVNGHPAVVAESHYSLAPRRIVVLLDMSGSMAGQSEASNKWRIAREALEDLLAQTPSDVPIALLTFSDRVRGVFDFSQSRTSVTAWLKDGPTRRSDIKVRVGTKLYDGVVAAAKLLEPGQLGDAIYMITDGYESSSDASEAAVTKLLLASGTRLFVFLLAERMPAGQYWERRIQDPVDSIIGVVRATGGSAFGVSGRRSEAQLSPFSDFVYDYDDPTREKLKLYTRSLDLEVSGFYIIQLDTHWSARKPGKVSVEIVDGGGQVRKDVEWAFQRMLPTQPK